MDSDGVQPRGALFSRWPDVPASIRAIPPSKASNLGGDVHAEMESVFQAQFCGMLDALKIRNEYLTNSVLKTGFAG